MAGQLIVLPGVTVAASVGVPRVNMNIPDTIASKIVSLKHVVSARALAPVVTGGVSGRCRATGAALVSTGALATSLALSEVGGKVGWGISGVGGGGLALPAGSLTASFTMVMAVARSAADVAGGAICNFLSGFDGTDTFISMLARYYGTASTSTTRQNNMVSSTVAVGTSVQMLMPAGAWDIFIIDFDAATRLLSIATNQSEPFYSATMASAFAPPVGSYLEIGYHVDSNGLRSSKVGDLYTFNDSLRRTDFGKTQLAELVASLKWYYGIQ